MFNLGLPEIGIIVFIALAFVGSDDIPKVAKTLGKFIGKVRYIKYLFSRQFEDFIGDDEVASKHHEHVKMLRKDDGGEEDK